MRQLRSQTPREGISEPFVDNFPFVFQYFDILALLERTVIYETPLDRFISEVVFFFEAEHQMSISRSQIKDKLQFFWLKYHSASTNEKEWTKIYKLGLRGLPGLGEPLKVWIRERAIELKHGLSATPRHLRSMARNPLLSSQSPTKRHSKFKHTIKGSRVEKSRSQSASPAVRKTKRKLFQSTIGNVQNKSILSTVEVIIPNTCKEVPAASQDQSTIIKLENERNNGLLSPDQPRAVSPQRSVSSLPDDDDDLEDESDAMSIRAENLESKNAQSASELERLRYEHVSEVRWWERRYRRSERRYNTLDSTNSLLQTDHGRNESQLRESNKSLQSQIFDLKNKNKYLNNINRFTGALSEDARAKILGEAIKDAETLESTMKKLLAGYEAKIVMDNIRRPKDHLLSLDSKIRPKDHLLELWEKGFGVKIKVHNLANNIPTAIIRGTDLCSVIKTLISAALCSWVFEKNVGGLFRGRNDVAYRTLRNLLAAQDENLINSFEFAVHEKCIKNSYIRKVVIPKVARSFAQRIRLALAPIIEAHRSLSDVYKSIEAEWLESEHILTDIFKLAFSIKIRLLLTSDIYKCVFPIPGMPFDADSMKTTTLDNISRKKALVVATTIVPGLSRSCAQKKNFSYNRFSSNIAPGETPEVVRKALVLTK